MPGPSRPFVAAKEFWCATFHFKEGDVIDNPLVLASVRPFGDEFIKAGPSAKASSNEDPPTPKTPKEGT